MNRYLAWWIGLRLRSVVALGLSLLIGLTAVCAIFVHVAEGWAWIDAAYFSVTSLTTLGYGDFVPTNDATKIFLIVFLPAGISLWFILVGTVSAKLVELQHRASNRGRESAATAGSQDKIS